MNEVSESECEHCLPDCFGTHYEASVTAAPFRRCDYKNFNLSPLCKIKPDEKDNQVKRLVKHVL